MIIALSIKLNICCGCAKEPSRLDGSFELQQHVFALVNRKGMGACLK